MRRSERKSLRFCQRGRYLWVEIVSESHPGHVPRKVTVSGGAIEDCGDFGTQFRTTALSSGSRILHVEETSRELGPDNDGSELRAYRDRVLQNLPKLLQQVETTPALCIVQPLPAITGQSRALVAFIDVPLPAEANAAVGQAIRCVECHATTRSDEVVSLNSGWGCEREGDGPERWRCPTCYGRLMALDPKSIGAVAWRARRARHQSDDVIREASRFLNDIEAIEQRRDEQALVRLTATLRPNATGPENERETMNEVFLALADASEPDRLRLSNGTALKDDDGRTARVAPNTVVYSMFRRWLHTKVRRISDLPHSRVIAGDEALNSRADPASASAESDLVCALDRKGEQRDLQEFVAELSDRLTPRERDLLDVLRHDDVSLRDAAGQADMKYGTAKTLMARIRQKAKALLTKTRRDFPTHRKNP
jgi:DNA-directed RNA polymerase specialized sigma24 family protein